MTTEIVASTESKAELFIRDILNVDLLLKKYIDQTFKLYDVDTLTVLLERKGLNINIFNNKTAALIPDL